MKVLNLLLPLALQVPKICFSQDWPQASAQFDLGGGLGSRAWSPSVLYHEQTSLCRTDWLKVGVGIRLWGLYAGQGDLYSQNNKSVADALQYQRLSVNGLSFVVGTNVTFLRVIDVGANTDLAGLAFGRSRLALYPKAAGSVPGEGAAFYNESVATAPTVTNGLPLAFKRQTGQSELFIRAKVSRRAGVKVGYLFSRITYATRNVDSKKVVLDNGQRHFSKTFGMPYAALSIYLFP